MAAPGVPLDLVNLALSKLYAKPITSLDDLNSPAARAGNMVYDQERRSLLRQEPWNFATVRGVVTLTEAAPIISMDGLAQLYTYAFPNNLLRLCQIGWDVYNDYCKIFYKVQGRNVLTNPFQPALGPAVIYQQPVQVCPPVPIPSIDILYVSDDTAISDYDPLFIDVLVYKLAIALCFPVTGNTQMVGALTEFYEESLKLAIGANCQENPITWVQPDPIRAGRLTGSDDWGGFF